VYPNLFCAHPPFQVDGNLGFTAGLVEMIVQSHRTTQDVTVVDLLPTLPAGWQEGAAHGLGARGGVTVDVSWSDGAVTQVLLRGPSGREVEVTLPEVTGRRTVRTVLEPAAGHRAGERALAVARV
jgi:alpha-L-fucosidase 2